VPVSFPVAWDSLDEVSPGDFTVRNAARLLAGADPWAAALPPPQALPEDLIAEGHALPVARVQAMHEGKRRARAQLSVTGSPGGVGLLVQSPSETCESLSCGRTQSP
jgi:bifunctional non-homologous end joining protein LigD